MTPFSSSTLTFSFSIARFDDTNDPATLRQFAQWHRWPRGRVNSSSSVMVTRMDLQRQVALREEENLEMSWEFGSPVSLEWSVIVWVGGLWGGGRGAYAVAGLTGVGSRMGMVYGK